MKRILFLSLTLMALGILIQCASVQTWPVYERKADDRMTMIKQRIGDGLKTGELSSDEARMLLARLDDIRRDYLALAGRRVHRDEWETLLGKLDVLEDEVNKKLASPHGMEGTIVEGRFNTVQPGIDDHGILI
jgi:hypothetical protein